MTKQTVQHNSYDIFLILISSDRPNILDTGTTAQTSVPALSMHQSPCATYTGSTTENYLNSVRQRNGRIS